MKEKTIFVDPRADQSVSETYRPHHCTGMFWKGDLWTWTRHL